VQQGDATKPTLYWFIAAMLMIAIVAGLATTARSPDAKPSGLKSFVQDELLLEPWPTTQECL
jgi:hypothetical protein